MKRILFDEQLALLKRELISMGGMCETSIASSCQSFLEKDTNLVKEVNDLYLKVSNKEEELLYLCFNLLLKFQPVASDLRTISSALKMITDLSRIGEISKDIASIISQDNLKVITNKQIYNDLALEVINMVTSSVDSYVKRDLNTAYEVIKNDDIVDDYFRQIKQLLIESVNNKNESEYIINLLMISKYLEKIGDHAVNIASWVVFSLTGNKPNK